jgi:hypothetical protein
MIKYLPVLFFLIIMTDCGRPERKIANAKKNSTDTSVIVKQPKYDEAMNENRFDVAKISGKSKEEVSKYLGEPSAEEKVTVRGNIPNCEKVTYIDGIIDVIFIKGKADWIKINDDPEMILIPAKNNYVSIEKFSDYIFVKTFTK